MTDRKTADVVELVREVLGVPSAEIGAASGMATVSQWDSVAQLNICLAFQERFGVEMTMEAIAEATSVSALVGLLPQGK